MATKEEKQAAAVELRRQQRRDRALEAAGLLSYQNPSLTAAQLNALTQSAISSGALDLSGASPRRSSGGSSGVPADAPSLPSLPDELPGTDEEPTDAPPPPPANDTAAILQASDPFKTIAETLMPFFSPEDRMNLNRVYGFGSPPGLPGVPLGITATERNNYLSRSRAEQALTALQNINPNIAADAGPGYKFLVNAVDILRGLGGSEGAMSRENYLQFDYALNNLMETAGSEIPSQYRDLANWFARPGFSAGGLVNLRMVNGQPVFGSANRRLFT